MTYDDDTRQLRARTNRKLRDCEELDEDEQEMAEEIRSEDFRNDDNRSRL